LGFLLVVCVAAWLFGAYSIQQKTQNYRRGTEELQPQVQEVRQFRQETAAKQAEISPLQARVDFVAAADKSGSGYWKAFHAVNKYIWEQAEVTQFSISPPNSVNFTVQIRGTNNAGRFVLNLLRCPALTGLQVSGVPGGVSAQYGTGAGVAAAPSAGAAAPAGPPGLGGSAMLPGPLGGGAGGGGAPAAGGAPPGSPEELITWQITATLTPEYTVTVPTPTATAVAPTASAGMGAPGGLPGPPGMGPANLPGGAPGGAPAAGGVGGRPPVGGGEDEESPGGVAGRGGLSRGGD